jgi:hypothetical protein
MYLKAWLNFLAGILLFIIHERGLFEGYRFNFV